jgi:hypothetical protein
MRPFPLSCITYIVGYITSIIRWRDSICLPHIVNLCKVMLGTTCLPVDVRHDTNMIFVPLGFPSQLGPHYRQAIQQKREEDLFQQAYACWFDIFPERRGDKDHDEFEWALQVRKRVRAHFSM